MIWRHSPRDSGPMNAQGCRLLVMAGWLMADKMNGSVREAWPESKLVTPVGGSPPPASGGIRRGSRSAWSKESIAPAAKNGRTKQDISSSAMEQQQGACHNETGWAGCLFVFLSLFPSFALWRQGGEGALHEGYITYTTKSSKNLFLVRGRVGGVKIKRVKLVRCVACRLGDSRF